MVDQRSSTADYIRDVVIGAIPAWGLERVDNLVHTLTSHEELFPCTFAVSAARNRTLRFGFIESLTDQASWAPLLGMLAEYLVISPPLGRDTSLVVFFGGPSDLRIEEYNKFFWAVLQYLHENDGDPWPEEIPHNPDHPLWEFSFAGESIFVVCNTPAHTKRRSRNNPGFMMTFQPRWALNELKANTAKGAAARKTIRQRIREFDRMEPYHKLGSYGDEDNREWRQYFLPEFDSQPLGDTCLFRATRGGGITTADKGPDMD